MRFSITILLLFTLQACSSGGETNGNASAATRPVAAAPAVAALQPALTYDTSTREVQTLKTYFHIEKEKGNGYFLQSYVYLSDTSKLRAVNRYLLVRYRVRHSEALDIWYFDKRDFVNKYLTSIDNPDISDKAFKAMDRHMICQYSQLRSEEEATFDYNDQSDV